jgi:hypothetical protein
MAGSMRPGVYKCLNRRCEEILLIVTRGGRVWVSAEAAEMFRSSAAEIRCVFPKCQRAGVWRTARSSSQS